MKHLKHCFLVGLFSSFVCLSGQLTPLPFDKVVIWGHKLHSHTHSYIHYGFERAFKALGYQTLWLDDNDSLDGLDLSRSLFITEGQVDKNIPLRDDCFYVLHNVDGKYKHLFASNRALMIQVYTKHVRNLGLTVLGPYIYVSYDQKVLYMPWATDLLPYEIDEIKNEVRRRKAPEKAIYWIGSIGDGVFGNNSEIDPFKKACNENNIGFTRKINISLEDNKALIQRSYMAPTIVGEWQKEQGYIPCRIFKNISYGQWGITNSQEVWELFNQKIVYNPDTYQLFYDAKKRLGTLELEELFELMDIVRDQHTYINRIAIILQVLEVIYNNELR